MADPKKINYYGNQTIDNSEEVDRKVLETKQELENQIAQKQDQLTFDNVPTAGSNNPVKSGGVKTAIDTVDTKVGELNALHTSNKQSIVKAINSLHDELHRDVDDTPTEGSDNLVTSGGVFDAIKSETDRATEAEETERNRALDAEEDLQNQISAEVARAESAEEAIQEQLDSILPYDNIPTEGSEKGVKSGGVFDAIRFASVKVGETMFWHESEVETRTMHSDNPFIFEFNGQTISVTPREEDVNLCISKNIPDGWHALDGSVELVAADYPDLAAFMPENVTNDGKIWLPYVQQKIIKVKY